MANELVHKTQGTTLTQAEYENVDAHVCNSQATGDVIYASSATQLTRLAVGSTSQVLNVIGGIPAWRDRPLAFNETLSVGNYFVPVPITGGGASAIAANRLYAMPCHVSRDLTADRIATQVTSAGGAGTVIRLGIYSDTGANAPGALLIDAGTVAADGATGVKAVTISQALTQALYWLAFISDGTPQLKYWDYAYSPLGWAGTDFGLSSVLGMAYNAMAYAALPATFPAITWSAQGWVAACRVASLD